ncbi:hypothetical protein RD792_012465 [Penstemon davidsonii]|uniref:RRM domain-containing protein n=1 Tax=Penstemon davidsonii TaxID=160366 RepID=A0ABR0CWY4_9LAMI|nr:hypothetical protein RD792_012465 [Penstemon davidsonii]
MEDTEKNKLFVGGISWQTTEDVLKEHFGKYGAVSESVICVDRYTGSPRGFGFVTFAESSAVDRVLEDSHQILSRTVEVKRAVPRSEQQSQQQHDRGFNRNNSRSNSRNTDEFRTKKIFVGGLSANVTEEEFKSCFEKFGRITDVVVMHDNATHRPRGFGFITFESEDSVEEVMQKNFHELAGKLVEVKRAVPKDGISSSSNSHNGRLAGERPLDSNSFQQVNYTPYSTSFGYYPSGYSNVPWYPYGAGIFNSGYPYGFGYGLPPVGPRSPWNPPVVSVGGSLLPYRNAAPFYPTYVNGLAANGYSGILGNGSTQLRTGNGQSAAVSTGR